MAYHCCDESTTGSSPLSLEDVDALDTDESLALTFTFVDVDTVIDKVSAPRENGSLGCTEIVFDPFSPRSFSA